MSSTITLTRPPSHELPLLTRRLSIEQTYALASTARRKSSLESTRNDLRLQLAHSNVLEHLLHDIAQNESARVTSSRSSSPETSPPATPTKHAGKHIAWAAAEVTTRSRYPSAEEFEYAHVEDEDDEEDLAGLTLVRTPSRRPQR